MEPADSSSAGWSCRQEELTPRSRVVSTVVLFLAIATLASFSIVHVRTSLWRHSPLLYDLVVMSVYR